MSNFDSWLDHTPVGMAKNLWYGTQHPEAFAKAVINWDDLVHDPMHWFGHLIPTLALGVASDGLGVKPAADIRAAIRTAAEKRLEKAQKARDLRTKRGQETSPDEVTLTPAHLIRLRKIELQAKLFAKRYGVKVDFTTRPIEQRGREYRTAAQLCGHRQTIRRRLPLLEAPPDCPHAPMELRE